MEITQTTLKIGLPKPVRVLHVTDTHVALTDDRDDERCRRTIERCQRVNNDPDGAVKIQHLRDAVEYANAHCDLLVHSGDFLCNVAILSIEKTREALEASKNWMLVAGNHEFTRYGFDAWEDETYKLKIVGIYKNSEASSTENNRFMMNDPANNIYMNYTAFSKIISASEKADNKTTDSSGNEKSAVLKDNLAFTYTFKNVDNYNTFSKKVYDLGLSDYYKVSSSDLTAYENSLRPLETLSTTAMWFFFIVLAVGGAILITLNVFSLRERKYEVGALTAIGMKKAKVAAQFVTEILIVTFAALIIGTSVGAVVSVPVTNTLLSSQIESEQSSSDKISQNFGFKNDGNSAPSMGTPPMGGHGMRSSEKSASVKYVDSVSSATNLMVILKLALVGLFLTLIASLAALICIMRYEPLKILSNRS